MPPGPRITRCVLAGLSTVLAFGTAAAWAVPAPAPSFEPLGDLDPAFGHPSEALACTPDGQVVVGNGANAAGQVAFRWSSTTGVRQLLPLPGGSPPYSQATAVSADGSVVAGISSDAPALGTAVRWVNGGPAQSLGFFPATLPLSLASGVSDDGSVIVGGSKTDSGLRAFRWTVAAGLVNMGLWSGVTQAQAAGISGDGLTIVGSGGNASNSYVQGFRWTAALGYRQITNFPGGLQPRLEAKTANADGSVIVGYGVSTRGYEAIVYTPAGGVVGLGDLPGGPYESYARAVNADGSVVVGIASTDGGYEAFYWTADRGLRRLADVLIDAGVSLNGYIPNKAQGVSRDGAIVVGSAISPTGQLVAFRATVPRPPPNADWNHSASVSVQDVFDFLAGYFVGRGDFNRDGATTIQDVFEFLGAWFTQQPPGTTLVIPTDPAHLGDVFDATPDLGAGVLRAIGR